MTCVPADPPPPPKRGHIRPPEAWMGGAIVTLIHHQGQCGTPTFELKLLAGVGGKETELPLEKTGPGSSSKPLLMSQFSQI